ncbi:MAG: hypothetical protein WAM97_00555 [Acidimicrobiales bacterium]
MRRRTGKPATLFLMLPVCSLMVSSCVSGPRAQATARPQHGVAVALSSSSTIADPPYFVYTTTNGTVEFRSPTTGALVKILAHFGQALTGNGSSLSPNGSNDFVSLIGRKDLYTERIHTSTAAALFEVDGIEAAVSPSGKYLAYTPGPDYSSTLSVKNLSAGSVSTINLESLLGKDMDLMNSTITWLGDGSQIVIMPSGVASATAHRDSVSSVSLQSQSAKSDSCSASMARTSVCLILVHFSASRSALTAERVVVNGIGGVFNVISAAQSRPRTLALAAWGEHTKVYWLTFSGTAVQVSHLVTMGMVLPVAFDALGTRLLYVVGHGPVYLWVTKFGAGHLVDAHKLLNSNDMSGATW